ncbi:MAG: lamin tail domain-containing protein, partial [Candidatus Marinimicrobia bacterium]|nr:lamin tail domain-containing protein [Candidatus Neomarinimicrobiota bacterium]
MKFLFTRFFFFSSQLFAQILFTEILYDLPGSDSPNEFVEIFNPSLTDTIHLDGWAIEDRLYTDTLEDSGDGLSIPPNGYGLILEGDYDLSNGIYQTIIPENTIIIKVDDSSIGNGLSGSDSLFLYD